MNKNIIIVLLCLSGFAAVFGQSVTRRFAAGYDEGLAARFFFNDRMGLQASLHYQYLGGYDETVNTQQLNNIPDVQDPETDAGLGVAFLFNLFTNDKVLVDAVGQVIVYHDGAAEESDYGDRNVIFLRIAACPEIIVAEHLGIGMKVGLEIVSKGETEFEQGGQVYTTDDATSDIRFFGPRNLFDGTALGLSLFYYF